MTTKAQAPAMGANVMEGTSVKPTPPAMALFVGWLVPGGGHLLLGKYIRGLLLMA